MSQSIYDPAVARNAAPGRRPGRTRRRAGQATVYLIVAVAVLIVAFPLLWMLATALKSNGQIVNLAAPLWPTRPAWSNIARAWSIAPFPIYFLNSAIFSTGATIGQVATGLLAGYAFAMFDFPGKRVLFYVVISGLMVPFTVVIVPVVQVLATLHWLNTYQGLIVPNLASALGAFLFRQFFFSAPRELGEAARIDGASETRVLRAIYVPLARPIIAAFLIISFLYNWSNFLFPLIVTSSTNKMVLSLGLSVFQTQFTVEYNMIMAASVIAVIPVLLVAVATQRQIVEGITLGASRLPWREHPRRSAVCLPG